VFAQKISLCHAQLNKRTFDEMIVDISSIDEIPFLVPNTTVSGFELSFLT
jgi:hypothetical protein